MSVPQRVRKGYRFRDPFECNSNQLIVFYPLLHIYTLKIIALNKRISTVWNKML